MNVVQSTARTLLVIGIHREELAFGDAVAAGLDRSLIDVLRIPEGISGRHPRADQRFHSDTLHRALYLQLLPHIQVRHTTLIDLHTGLDSDGPCADLYCHDIPKLATLLERERLPTPPPRLIRLLNRDTEGGNATKDFAGKDAATVIPAEIWNHPTCLYVGMEIYLPGAESGSARDQEYARNLIEVLSRE